MYFFHALFTQPAYFVMKLIDILFWKYLQRKGASCQVKAEAHQCVPSAVISVMQKDYRDQCNPNSS